MKQETRDMRQDIREVGDERTESGGERLDMEVGERSVRRERWETGVRRG